VTEASDIAVFDQGNDQVVIVDRKLKESNLIVRNRRAGSLARLGHLLDVQKIAGSNPVRPTTNEGNVEAAGIIGEKVAERFTRFFNLYERRL
jgi:hypothetical protein